MDLGNCPRCGKEWAPGNELCSNCGFVPIGAGLKSIPKSAPVTPEEKKVYRRRAVQTRANFVATLGALMILTLFATFEPWVNDWETVRVWFGDAPARSMKGTWLIAGAKLVDAEHTVEYPDDLMGTFTFGDKEVRLKLERGSTKAAGTGEYALHGSTLILRNVKAEEGGGDALPKKVLANIAWMDANAVVAEVEQTEILYLVRQ